MRTRNFVLYVKTEGFDVKPVADGKDNKYRFKTYNAACRVAAILNAFAPEGTNYFTQEEE